MKRATISLNIAGSSRWSTWPDFGKKVSPDAGRCFFRNRLGSTQESSSSPQMISAGVVTFLIASRMVYSGASALETAHGVGRAPCVMSRQRRVEVGVAARVLDQEG